MKNILKFMLAASFISLVTLNSCDPNGDNDPDVDVRTKFVSDWSCVEQGGPAYPVTISLDPNNSAQVLINNFHLLGVSEKAYAIATTSTLTIPSQEIANNTVNGSGTLVSENKINLTYTVNDHSQTETFNATYTK
jgi:hypothetical protein